MEHPPLNLKHPPLNLEHRKSCKQYWSETKNLLSVVQCGVTSRLAIMEMSTYTQSTYTEFYTLESSFHEEDGQEMVATTGGNGYFAMFCLAYEFFIRTLNLY